MTLETDLRAALQHRAASIEIDPRITNAEYHPRTHRRTAPIAVGGAAGVAGTTAAILALTATSATTAFAKWTAKPTVPAPNQIALAARSCDDQSPVAGLPLVLTDTRGPFTFQIYANDTTSAVCTSGPGFESISGQQSSGSLTPPAGKLESAIVHTTNRDGAAYAFADGRIGAGVTDVKLALADGSTVTATVQNGWFVAWWPGGQRVRAAEVTTASGTTTQTIDEPPQPAGQPTARTKPRDGQMTFGQTSVAHSGRVTSGFSVNK